MGRIERSHHSTTAISVSLSAQSRSLAPEVVSGCFRKYAEDGWEKAGLQLCASACVIPAFVTATHSRSRFIQPSARSGQSDCSISFARGNSAAAAKSEDQHLQGEIWHSGTARLSTDLCQTGLTAAVGKLIWRPAIAGRHASFRNVSELRRRRSGPEAATDPSRMRYVRTRVRL